MKIFLSVSYSSKVDPTGKVMADYRSELEDVISVFEQDDHQVFCAPREDGWKLNDASPAEAFNLDIKTIDDCGIFMAFVGGQVSAGIQLEIGYALAKGKRIVIVSHQKETLSYINKGLVDTNRASLITYDSQHGLVEKLKTHDLR